MSNLKKLFYEIDHAESKAEMEMLEDQMKDSRYTKAFWEFRKTALDKEIESEQRDKAKLKCRAIARMYNATIPAKKNIQKFSAPYGFTGILISFYAKIGKG